MEFRVAENGAVFITNYKKELFLSEKLPYNRRIYINIKMEIKNEF